MGKRLPASPGKRNRDTVTFSSRRAAPFAFYESDVEDEPLSSTKSTAMPSLNTTADRAAGAIMGALIGDALALGPHWYYDRDEQRRDYGDWITGYTDPKPGRYHAGMHAGQLSQTGLLIGTLLRSVAARGGYDEADWTRRMDADFLPHLDGTPMHGPGGYTNQDMRDVYRLRVKEGKLWGQCASDVDTTEAAARMVVLAARYADDPRRAAAFSAAHGRLTQDDGLTLSLSVAFACVVSALVRGEAMDAPLSDKLMALTKKGVLPFGHVTGEKFGPPPRGGGSGPRDGTGHFPSPDGLLLPGYCAEAARDPAIRIEPAWKVATLYGLPCAIYGPLPAAYYLAARFAGEFEAPVLHALNGGGQNMARACLTGALAGAQVGLRAIPAHLIDGLENGAELAALALQVTAPAEMGD